MSEVRKYQIKKFLVENPNSQFKGIFDHLEKIGLGYNSNKGLAKILDSMRNSKEITKNEKAKPYPTYDVTNDDSLISGILGERFREEFTEYAMGSGRVGIDENYWRNDVKYEINDNFEKKFIKTMVTRYGFYLLSVFVKGLEQSVTNKNFDKNTWMSYALDLMKDEEFYFNSFVSLLNEKNKINTKTKSGKKQLIKLLDNVLESMDELYPKLYQEINYYKFAINQPENINALKKNKKFRKKLTKK